MKCFIALVAAICIIGSASSVPQYGYANQQVAPVGNTFLFDNFAATLASNIVQNIVSRIVLNIVAVLVQLAPNAVVPVPTLLTALQALGNPTLSILLTAIFALLGVKGASVLPRIPPGLVALQLNGPDFLQFLLTQIPPNTAQVPLPFLANLLGNYLSKLLITILSQLWIDL